MKKAVVAAGMAVLVVMGAAGCGNGQDVQQEIVSFSSEKADMETGVQSGTDETEYSVPERVGLESGENNGSVSDDLQQDSGNSQDTMIIGGKVRSVAQDCFVISRTLYADSNNSVVIMPEAGSAQEELVTVQCTSLTVFERQIIQGCGAGIETSQAAFSEIGDGVGVEAFGYFDGEEFVADKVWIEIYK